LKLQSTPKPPAAKKITLIGHSPSCYFAFAVSCSTGTIERPAKGGGSTGIGSKIGSLLLPSLGALLAGETVPDGNDKKSSKNRGPRTYVTYTKTNSLTNEIYSGRASGFGTPQEIADARDARHHVSGKGWGAVRVDRSIVSTYNGYAQSADPAWWAIRGREQQLIDLNGGAQSDFIPTTGNYGTSGNKIRAVAKGNPMGRTYWTEATAVFGPLTPYTGK